MEIPCVVQNSDCFLALPKVMCGSEEYFSVF